LSQRIIFVNRYFHPDESATSQILSDLAFHLAGQGREVHVVASGQLYGQASARMAREETTAGVRIHRISTTRFGRTKLVGRMLDYISFYVSSFFKVASLAGRGDVVVAKTDPPLLSIPVGVAARLRGATVVNWLQDIFPEAAAVLGVPLVSGFFVRALARWRDVSLRRAAHNVVICEKMAERLTTRGLDSRQVTIVHNWSDDAQISPVRPSDNPLRGEWGLSDCFVVGYSGNLGRAHEWETLIQAAQGLRAARRLKFLFIGGGHRMAALHERIARIGLGDMFLFKPYQERRLLTYSLCVPDAHWVSLRPELEGLILPSKLYGAMAAGRPVIAISATDGDVAHIVRQANCGFVIQPGDAPGLERAISAMMNDRGLTERLGAAARRSLETRYRKTQSLAQWEMLLSRIS
jgi:colanic acid biosynthesis glycosyl transferase WcaI